MNRYSIAPGDPGTAGTTGTGAADLVNMAAGARRTWAALMIAAFAGSAAQALPRGEASALVAPFGAPCLGTSCLVTSGGVLVPLPNGDWRRDAHIGAVGAQWNTADARVQLRPGAPGEGIVQLGVAATLLQYATLTADGLPGAPLAPQLIASHSARGSASYLDQISFLDAALPALAPITVSLTWALTTSFCFGAISDCRSPTPDTAELIAGAVPALSFAYTALQSRIQLPGGANVADDQRLFSEPPSDRPVPPDVTPLIRGLANQLTHTFGLLNGQSYEYSVSAAAEIRFDGAALLPVGSGNVADPLRVSYLQLPYLGSAHLVALAGVDAQGQPLEGLQMRNSLGWSLLPEPLAAVPEPGAAWLFAAGALLLGVLRLPRRERRHAAAPRAAGLAATLAAALLLAGCEGTDVEPEAATARLVAPADTPSLDLTRAGDGEVVLRLTVEVSSKHGDSYEQCPADESTAEAWVVYPGAAVTHSVGADGVRTPLSGLVVEGTGVTCGGNGFHVFYRLRVTEATALSRLPLGELRLPVLPEFCRYYTPTSRRTFFGVPQSGDPGCERPRVEVPVRIAAVPAIGEDGSELQVTVSGPGRVVSDPAGIDCAARAPSDCIHAYPSGSTVGLRFEPEGAARLLAARGDAGCAQGRVTLAGRLTRCEVEFGLGAWQTEVASLTQTPPDQGAYILPPSLALGTQRQAVVAWAENGRVHVRLADGRVSTLPTTSASGPPSLVMMAGTDVVAVAIEEETASQGRNVRVMQVDPSTGWFDMGGAPMDIELGNDAYAPQLAARGGRMVLAWLESVPGSGLSQVMVREWIPFRGWLPIGQGESPTPVPVGQLERPLITITGASAPLGVALAWFNGGSAQVAELVGTSWVRRASPSPGMAFVADRASLAWSRRQGLLFAGAAPSGGTFVVRQWLVQDTWRDLGLPRGSPIQRDFLIDVVLADGDGEPLLAYGINRSNGAVIESVVERYDGTDWVRLGGPLPQITRHGNNAGPWSLTLVDGAQPVAAVVLNGNVPGRVDPDHTLTLARFD
jgi:hypothetical protein